jgi:hypothetical protein
VALATATAWNRWYYQDGQPRVRRPQRRVRGLPYRAKVWTADELAELRALQRDFAGDARESAIALGRALGDVNRALDALLGRTPEAAALALASPAPAHEPVEETLQ